MPRPAPVAGTPLAMAKDRARRAHKGARQADAALSAIYDRWFAETLLAIERQPAAKSIMWSRVAILFEIVIDRRGWPERMR
jgi:hypothetical protein